MKTSSNKALTVIATIRTSTSKLYRRGQEAHNDQAAIDLRAVHRCDGFGRVIPALVLHNSRAFRNFPPLIHVESRFLDFAALV
jgi:hypothetical protein